MACRIEDYALIGDCYTAALVACDGSIDWLSFARFDSGACFAALLGTPEHGRWLLAPRAAIRRTRRKYRDNTLILETEFETAEGTVALVDFMSVRDNVPSLSRVVEGRRGRVTMGMELSIRCDYGSIVPWVRRCDGGILAIAGPDSLMLRAPVEMRGEAFTTVAEFTVAAGESVPFTMTWHPSHLEPPPPVDTEQSLHEAEAWWQEWAARCNYRGPYREAVVRSLITLKALTYAPTGGIVAAATTSLPEQIGGVRNWDYRYCWIRDAAFVLLAFLNAGYQEEARSWRDWLLRAIAGNPDATNIMYGLAGERRLTELVLDWLPGYENSRPVRIDNAASQQFQLDIYGEMLDALYLARRLGMEPAPAAWNVGRALVNFVASVWQQPDEGIWEVRGPRRHFTHSKVMAWVALDRAVKAVENFGVEGPVDAWRLTRDAIHDEVCRKGFSIELGSFVQYYGAEQVDASLLLLPLVGFLPASDPRVRGTVEAVQRHLLRDGFVARYEPKEDVDGLPPGEGAFLACTFWLADNLALLGRRDEATQIFERLLELRNDVGLLSEEYDPHAKRLVGNFPQAFSHIGLVNTAMNLSSAEGPADQRPKS
jgi:GH15 family glucan-1,4-alpha-glucosidase